MTLKKYIENFCARFRYGAPLCLLAGALSALAMPPWNYWFVLFAGLPVFYCVLAHSKSAKRAFACGWLFGFGYFVVGLSWIGNALLIDGNPYKWAWPLAVAGLPALLSFFWAFFALAAQKLGRLETFSGWLAFVGLFGLTEWLRGHLFTGFPWNLFGFTWSTFPEVIQILSLSDVYGLTLLTLFWCSAPAMLAIGTSKSWKYAGGLSILSFAIIHGYGQFRLHHAPDEYLEDIHMKIIQPNIPQSEKWDREKLAQHFETLIALSANADQSKIPTYIIWPETALTYRFAEDPIRLRQIVSMLQSYPQGSALLTGMLRLEREHKIYANSLVMFNQSGEMANIYDKHHLVPFGEYIPFQHYIPLRPIVEFSGFKRGDGPHNFSTGLGHTYSPLVCYEIIFPGRSLPEGEKPDVIVNVTNDAWYGISAGPYQHFTQALYRAVETGVPVVRSANTGFSGMITPTGRIIQKTELMTISNQTTPMARTTNATVLHSATKNAIFLFLVTVLILQSVIMKSQRTNRN